MNATYIPARFRALTAILLLMAWPGEAWGQKVADSEVKRSLKQALKRDFRLRDAEIDVTAFMGTATLKGTVNNYFDRHLAEQIAKRTVGVRAVVNRIQVESAVRRDHAIAEDVKRRVSQSSFLRPIELEVQVAGGVVTLAGEVPDWAQSRYVETVAREVRGVRLVRNKLTVRSSSAATARTDQAIQSDVEAALRRDSYLSNLPIIVSVQRGVVKLDGEVPNLFHHEHAGEKARLIANVRQVENQLVVVSQQILDRLPERPTDAELRQTVHKELQADPRVAATQIDVGVARGHVTLVGIVASMFERQAAERITRSVSGVTRVENQLMVMAVGRTDVEIEADIQFSLKSDSILDGQAVAATVRDAAVVLSGEVKDYASKFHAARIVARVRGVRSLNNEIKVRWNAAANDDAVRAKIENRLRSNGITRPIASDIRVTLAKGDVTLAGVVDSSAQRNEVEFIARLTDGVRTVNNKLTLRR